MAYAWEHRGEMVEPTLSVLLLAALPQRPAAVPLDLEEQIAAGVATARAAWPEIDLAGAHFLAHVGRSVRDLDALRRLHWGDLYLACACACGETRALRLLEDRFLTTLDAPLRRRGANPDVIQEVKQRVREDLLVAPEGTPRLFQYSGTGPLRAWLRVVAVRRWLRLERGTGREVDLDSHDIVDRLCPDEDAALTYIKKAHAADLAGVVRRAIRQLTPRERNLLRHRVIDDLTVDEIAVRYGVHRVTASRWFSATRHKLLDLVRRTVMRDFRIGEAEADSLIALVRSRVDLSLGDALGREPSGEA
jgi:RNA polymerase sigma-70 factor, ECF subfamily